MMIVDVRGNGAKVEGFSFDDSSDFLTVHNGMLYFTSYATDEVTFLCTVDDITYFKEAIRRAEKDAADKAGRV